MNTKQVGEVSEAKVMTRLMEREIPVLDPWGDNQRYDFVIDVGDFLSVQVKTAQNPREGVIKFPCHSVGRNGKNDDYRGDVDLFGVYSPDLEECFLVPVEDAGRSEMNLRFKMPKNGQRKGITWAVDYIL